MNLRPCLAVFLLLANTAPAAGLEKYRDWGKSPEFGLATEAEQKDWRKIASDAEAERFIQLFWARRDPDLATSVNEFRAAFQKRVADADQLFALPRTRGALTERGRLYVLVGPPKSLLRVVGIKAQPIVQPPPAPMPPPNDPGTSVGESLVTFLYEAAQLPAWSPVKSLRAEFVVESDRDYVSGGGGGEVRRLEVKAQKESVRNPSLKEPPAPLTPEQLEAERRAAEAAAIEAGKGPALSAPVRDALASLLGQEDSGTLSLLPVVHKDRETRLQIQLFVPQAAGAPAENVKLAVLVRSAAGVDAARLEEQTALEPTAGGAVASRMFAVPPGSYGVAAGLFDSAGKLLVSARRTTSVVAAATDFSLSPVVVASSFSPAPKARADEAFTLNGFRFVTKGGRLDPRDGLLFVVRVYNPRVDPATKTAHLSRKVTIQPKGGRSMDLPQAADQPFPVPDSKDGSELLLVDVVVEAIESNLGAYLSKPGDYDLRVAITDEVAHRTLEASSTFTVTGVLPPKG